MTDQLPIEPLTKDQRAGLSIALVKMLLLKENAEEQKANVLKHYNDRLKVINKDIHDLTVKLDEPSPEEQVQVMGKVYMTDHQVRAGIKDLDTINDMIETIEVTGDDLPDDDTEIPF